MSKNLYKFISLEDAEHRERFKQIIKLNSLYMGNYQEQSNVNDDNEGHYYISADTSQKLLDKISIAKLQILICSMSYKCKKRHLWKHFADNGKGVCISVEIDGNVNVKKIKYVNELPYYSESYLKRDPTKIAEKILIHKLKKYTDEKEIRALKCISCGEIDKRLKIKIKRAYLGWNMPRKDVEDWKEILQENHIPVIVLHKEIKDPIS